MDAMELNELISSRTPESQTLDYKGSVAVDTDSERIEFLCDVCGMANSNGGTVLVGVVEERKDGKNTGIPISFAAVPLSERDGLERQLAQLVRARIVPPLLVRIYSIPVGKRPEDGFVVALEVPKSISAPHAVVMKDDFRFRIRSGTIRSPMRFEEIRQRFGQSFDRGDRIRARIAERLQEIRAGDTTFPIDGKIRLCLHVIPLAEYELGTSLALPQSLPNWEEKLPMVGHTTGHARYNTDGILNAWSPSAEGKGTAYTQLYRTGWVESVTTELGMRIMGPADNQWRVLDGVKMHCDLIAATRVLIATLGELGVAPPYAVFISLLNARGAFLDGRQLEGRYVFDRHIIRLPEVIFGFGDEPVEEVLAPALDALWQAVGVPRSPKLEC